MNRTLIGAVSMAALLAVGLSACGQQESEYGRTAEDEAGSQSGSEESTDDQYAANQPGADSQSGAAEEPAPNTGGLAPGTLGSATTEAPDDGMEVAIADISSKSDAERVAGDAFDQADANSDGKLDRAEYMSLAMSAEQYRSAPGADAGAAEGELPGMEPPDEAPSGETDVGGAMPGAPDPAQMTESATAPAIDAAFAEAAGDDGAMTEEELRAAFLARFEVADADGDDQLDETERQTFAQIIAGSAPSQ